jgi:hypothetical protein
MMGLQTTTGINLPTWLLSAAASVARKVEASQYSELYRLVSNARQTITGSEEEWKPFFLILLEAQIDRNNPDHLTALMIELLPKVVAQQRDPYIQAVEKSRARLAEQGVQGGWAPSGKFALTTSTASSTSIAEGADRLALALDRLSKK